MKKFSKYFVAAAIVVAATAAVLVGCKKEEQTSGKQEKSVSRYDETQQPSESEEKIISFINDYQGMKKGEKAEGEALSLEEARWQWETTLNYCYGFTQDEHIELRHDTMCMDLPKPDFNGKIAYVDILQTYADIVDAVRECYNAIDMEDKFLKYVTISFDNGAKDGDNATVVINTGKSVNGIDPQGPFNVGECYLWGTMNGIESTNTATYQEDLKVFNYDLQMMYNYTPCPTCTTWIDNISDTTYYGYLENNDSLFYATGLTFEEAQNYQICYDDLNREYYFIVKRGHWGQPTNLYGINWYYYTDVSSGRCVTGRDEYSVWHDVKVSYCDRHWRQGDTPYPIPINEEH